MFDIWPCSLYPGSVFFLRSRKCDGGHTLTHGGGNFFPDRTIQIGQVDDNDCAQTKRMEEVADGIDMLPVRASVRNEYRTGATKAFLASLAWLRKSWHRNIRPGPPEVQ